MFGACSVSVSCGPGRDSSAKIPSPGLYPKLRESLNFGSLISTLRPLASDQTVTRAAKSEKTRISSAEWPNSTLTILPMPPLPLLILADHCLSPRSQTRTLVSSASSTLSAPLELLCTGDHRTRGGFLTFSVEGSGMLRTMEREHVARICNRDPRSDATYAPSGEATGRDNAVARCQRVFCEPLSRFSTTFGLLRCFRVHGVGSSALFTFRIPLLFDRAMTTAESPDSPPQHASILGRINDLDTNSPSMRLEKWLDENL